KEAQAAINQKNSRLANKAWFDSHKRIRHERLKVGDLVLLFNSATAKVRISKYKLTDKWRGPYRSWKAPADSTHYFLEELDGTRLANSFAGDQLKKYFSRATLDRMRAEFGKASGEVAEDEEEMEEAVEEEIERAKEAPDDLDGNDGEDEELSGGRDEESRRDV